MPVAGWLAVPLPPTVCQLDQLLQGPASCCRACRRVLHSGKQCARLIRAYRLRLHPKRCRLGKEMLYNMGLKFETPVQHPAAFLSTTCTSAADQIRWKWVLQPEPQFDSRHAAEQEWSPHRPAPEPQVSLTHQNCKQSMHFYRVPHPTHAACRPGGGVGEMTTPELLAKREQRRRMEAQAAALSRPSLSRRLLQPLHNQPQLQQQPATSSGQQQAGRSVFSRAGLKRPAPAAKAAAPPPAADAPAGISAEDLAKVCVFVVTVPWQATHAAHGIPSLL